MGKKGRGKGIAQARINEEPRHYFGAYIHRFFRAKRKTGHSDKATSAYLNALNFMLSHTTLPAPPRAGLSWQSGQHPICRSSASDDESCKAKKGGDCTFARPTPFVNLGVYRSSAFRGTLYVAPGIFGLHQRSTSHPPLVKRIEYTYTFPPIPTPTTQNLLQSASKPFSTGTPSTSRRG